MVRPLRIEYPDAWYHVMNRGRRGEKVFTNSKDFEIFIALLQETAEMFDIRVAAFCLMSNHYHILLQTPAGNLSRAMRHVNGVYTQRYNRRRNIDGQLFRGRYKSVLVQEDNHLLELLRYIHRNPVRAHICNTVDEYPWSSHHGYISSAKKWNWLYKDFLLGMFSEDENKKRRQYRNFVQCEDSSVVSNFFDGKKAALFFGSEEYIEWIKSTFQQLQNHEEIPQSRALAPTIAEIKNLVCQCYAVAENKLEQTKRGETNQPRSVAIYLVRKRCGLPLLEIGQAFGLEKYSSVSSIVTRVEKRLSKNKQMQKQIGRINLLLNKSQAKT